MKLYEVGFPSDETWVFEVLASNKEEAMRIAKAGQYPDGTSVHQIHTMGGSNTYVRVIKLTKKQKLEYIK